MDFKSNKHFLSKIIKNKDILNIINDSVYRTNNIVFHTYNFLKLYILHLYDNKLELPIINDNFIGIIMNLISTRKTNQGRAPNINTQNILNTLTILYNNNYKEVIIEEDIINNDRLSFILHYEAIDIVKNIKNNIHMHFIKHLTKYIKIKFKFKKTYEIINIIDGKDLKNQLYNNIHKDLKKQLYNNIHKEIKNIIEDILNVSDNNYKSDIKYHEWINKKKYKLIPKKEKYKKNSINYDVCANTMDYFKNFIYINKKLEKLSLLDDNIKLFNILPLKKSLIPTNITLDTACIISILCNNNTKFFKNINNYKDEIWNKFFNLDNKVFKRNNYKFNHMIKTDGISATILLVKVDENQQSIKHTFNEILNIEKRRVEIDKQYIENQDNINEIFLNKNYVVIDPNKEDLIYCMDKNGNKFRYTQSQRNKETKSKKYKLILEDLKKKTIIIYNNEEKSVKEIESELSKYNTKTSNYEKFKEYLLLKNKLNSVLTTYYKEPLHRKLKMNRFINMKRSESNMILNFRKKFGKPEDTIVLMGDYDEKGKYLKGKEPTICSKIRYLLRTAKYKVYLINEFRTSKLCYNCESEVNRFHKRKDEDKLVWGLVCCQNKNCVRDIHTNDNLKYDKRIINRDTNAVLNMLKITKSLIEKGDRPWALTRAQAAREKIQEALSASNIFSLGPMRFKRLKTSI